MRLISFHVAGVQKRGIWFSEQQDSVMITTSYLTNVNTAQITSFLDALVRQNPLLLGLEPISRN
jgi:hypothetical protein